MMDNTKKIAVYMPAMTNSVWSESINDAVDVPVIFDPMTTAMLNEFNPAYVGDSDIGKLTVENYDLLIVPVSQMSASAASQIQTYINSGGSVWFMNDPCLTPTGHSGVQLTGILGNVVSGTTRGTTNITIVNTDDITNGLAATFKPVGTTSKASIFRTFSTPSGTIAGLNYQVLMSSGTAAMLVKFENPSNGARVIYSNPNMFISGGTASYFNAQTASKLFTQTKAWVMKFALNPSGVEVTYPNSDKQLTVTSDDEECTSWDVATIDPMVKAETDQDISPSAINTFYVLPSADMIGSQLTYYSQYGDTHTLHPHLTVWDTPTVPVDTYVSDIAADKAIVNKASGSPDYGFTSWRFPMTTYCANSIQAVANSGFTIDTSNGDNGDLVGSPVDNTLYFPKQVLVNNAKVNLIEYELPTGLDIDYNTGAAFATGYNTYSNQFKYGNFPMNFIIAGHYQGMATNCGVPGWGVTSTGLTSGLTTILSTQKAANPNFANMNTLANYINGVKSATIRGSVDGAVTTINITNSKSITDFTLKTTLGSVISATCDGAPAKVTQDSLTGNTYITTTLATGPHTFVITGTNTQVPPPTPIAPVASFTPVTSSGNAPLTVNFTSNSTGTSPLNLTWDFGDGAKGTGATVSHQFNNTGTTVVVYNVKLTAQNTVGTNTTNGTVTVNIAKPVPAFTYSPTSGINTSTMVTFNDTSSNNPTSSSWKFGDGGNATGNNVTHTFTKSGSISVQLTTTNAGGSANLTKTISVGAVKPEANFSYSPKTVVHGNVVTFTDSSTNYPTSWKWTFSDTTTPVTTTTGKTTHTFRRAGTYTVSLVSSNSAGSSTSVSQSIKVS
jgi:PKD repeat protein